MKNCLVKEFLSASNDSTLPKIGEVKFAYAPVANNSDIRMSSVQWTVGHDVTIRLEGAGHFTDSTGTDNLGKEYTLTPPANGRIGKTFYVSKEGGDVFVSDKYYIRYLLFNDARVSVCIEDFLYNQIAFENFEFSDSRTAYADDHANIYGDITDLAIEIAALKLKNNENVYGSVKNILEASLSMTALFLNNNFAVETEWLDDMTSLTSIYAKLVGDIKYLAKNTNTVSFYEQSANTLTGTIEGYVAYTGAESGSRTFRSLNLMKNVTLGGVSMNQLNIVKNSYEVRLDWSTSGGVVSYTWTKIS